MTCCRVNRSNDYADSITQVIDEPRDGDRQRADAPAGGVVHVVVRVAP
jgi:hypothetical protein